MAYQKNTDYENEKMLDSYKDSCRELFDAIDKDGDGLIGVNELKNYLKVLGQKATKEEVIKMIEDADGGNKGCLEYKDFELMITQRNRPEEDEFDEESLILDSFQAFGGNKDKSGEVKSNAIQTIVEDEFALDIDIRKLLEAQDLNKSEDIDYDEFKSFLLK